jgi:hypothetical protein
MSLTNFDLAPRFAKFLGRLEQQFTFIDVMRGLFPDFR